jgi:GNAT superfamily N-acetyltransferase
VILRAATPLDVPILLRFIQALAAFEREPDAVKMTEPQLHDSLFGPVKRDSLFGPVKRAEALLVEIDGVPQGAALWYESFNTWTGRPGLSVEDVYVSEAYRGHGIGRAIFKYLAKLTVERGYLRMDWQVLDWNAPAIKFYDSLGAEPQSAWLKYRLSGQALAALALN